MSKEEQAKTGDAVRLAEEHWNYIESLRLKELEMEAKMYKDAFIHGYKHGAEAGFRRVEVKNE